MFLRIKDENGNWVSIDVIKGEKGDKGDPGERGADGAPGKDGVMTFEELTPEQRETLKGDTGDSGVYIGETEPTDEDVLVWIDTTGDEVEVATVSGMTTAIEEAINAITIVDEVKY